jgi:hypothetical protein
MEPIEQLGPHLRHAGHDYTLWLARDCWHLFRGEANGTSFRFFLIIRADPLPGPAESADCYCLRKPQADVKGSTIQEVLNQCPDFGQGLIS